MGVRLSKGAGQTFTKLYARCQSCLERPRPANIAHSIAAATKQKKRLVERLDEFHTISVTCHMKLNQSRSGKYVSYRAWTGSTIQSCPLIMSRFHIAAQLRPDHRYP
jgi:hypothetical protein